MMYSVTFTSFASINDVKVHYHGGSSTGPFIVTTVINGTTTYTAITDLNKGSRYEGHFVPSLPLNKGDKLIGTGVITTVQTTIAGLLTQLKVDHSSGIGNNSANIFVSDQEQALPSVFDLGVIKEVNRFA